MRGSQRRARICPAGRSRPPRTAAPQARTPEEAVKVVIPIDVDNATLGVGGREVRLTNLRKMFWPERGITKGALIQYYADVAPVLLPHIRDRAMVMRRYPNGVEGRPFFMKEAPTPRPAWIRTCAIPHRTGVVNFPVIDDLPSLLWVINL